LKRKLLRQKKKEEKRKMTQGQSGMKQKRQDATPEANAWNDEEDSKEPNDAHNSLKKTGNRNNEKAELKLTAQSESASKKKRPFDYIEKEDGSENGQENKKPFALKDLDPEQMRQINKLLMEYMEVPRSHTLPKRVLIPSPDMRPEALEDENLSQMQKAQLIEQQKYF
jgi:hypothetical protein